MYTYYNVFTVNTALKLHQKIGPKDVSYEQVQSMYLEEYRDSFTKEDFEEYQKWLKKPFRSSKVQQYVVFNYEWRNQKILVEVTPGLTDMRILNIELIDNNLKK